MVKKITKEVIKDMSYTEFVGFINQWNVLPGAHDTLSKWAVFSKLDSSSKILEIACTTGFSSRELSVLTGCRGDALDICESSVKSAIENKQLYASDIPINYFVESGYDFIPKNKYSHVVIGAALKFFPYPEKMIKKCIDFLDEGGFILASPFFIKKPLPLSLINRFKKVFGITPTIESYKDIMSMYVGFEIIFQEINDIYQETEDELVHYCKSTIDRACKLRNIDDELIYSVMYDRLYEIKKMSNDLRPYQGYVVLVLRYRSFIYPNRYVELF